MNRVFSRFNCHRLNQYSWLKPRLSNLVYRLPLKKTGYWIETGSPAHIGPHSGAIDFIVPVGTTVTAAANGEVIEAIDNYRLPKLIQLVPHYLTTRFFRGQLNYLSLRHCQKNIEEFSFYAHLDKNSLQVKIGQKVRAGQLLAKTGWSGWLDKPHLHFVVYTEKVTQFLNETHESLEPKWQDQS